MLGVGLVAGMSGICIGRAIGMIGITLTNSLTNGVALTVEAFVLLLIQHREALHGKVGMSLIAGLALGAIGVVILAIAIFAYSNILLQKLILLTSAGESIDFGRIPCRPA